MSPDVYSAVFENASLGMAVISQNGTILSRNKAFERLSRERQFSSEIASIVDLLQARDRPVIVDRLAGLGEVGQQQSWLSRLGTEGGSAIWQFDAAVISLDEAGPLLALSVRGVTRQRKTEQTLKRAKEEAERATRTKSAFLANMSHEIRTPIHTVTGMTELLSETELDEEQREYAEQIRFSADVLLFLINDILDFSKIEAGRLSLELIDVPLGAIVEEAVEMVSLQSHRKGVEMIVHLDRGVPQMVRGDPGRLRQIIINLTNNAVKFTTEGQITVRVSTVDSGPEISKVRVEVSDTGIGIPEEKQRTLFQAFSQVDSSTTRKFGGTGLGLSICNSLVGMMGGEIGVESAPGTGSTFWFEIPCAVQQPAKTPEPILGEVRVLLVDDNAASARAIEEYARRLGGEVVSVSTGEEAVEHMLRAESADDPFGLVLIDLELPGMDGWQLASRITSQPSIADVPRILMSPKGLLAGEAKMKRLRWFHGYISKPIALDEFNSAVSAATLDVPELEPVEDEAADLLEEVINSSARIVVAEDHLVNQTLFRTILEKLGHTVVLAGDGREAIEAANSGHVDLVFMDVQMPALNGYEATRALRDQGFSRPIIAVTANAVKGEREKALASGMDDFLTKPFKKKDLVTVLDEWLDTSRERSTAGGTALPSDPSEMEFMDMFHGSAEFPVPEEALGRPLAEETGVAIDLAAALERFMGRREIVDKVISEFLRKLVDQLAAIDQLTEALDYRGIRQHAHAIKGGAWSLQAVPVGNAAALLEASAKLERAGHCRYYAGLLREAAGELKHSVSTGAGDPSE